MCKSCPTSSVKFGIFGRLVGLLEQILHKSQNFQTRHKVPFLVTCHNYLSMNIRISKQIDINKQTNKQTIQYYQNDLNKTKLNANEPQIVNNQNSKITQFKTKQHKNVY